MLPDRFEIRFRCPDKGSRKSFRSTKTGKAHLRVTTPLLVLVDDDEFAQFVCFQYMSKVVYTIVWPEGEAKICNI
jgi:hypothetical protein